MGLGELRTKATLTAPYYIYKVAFRSRRLPDLAPHLWLHDFPRTAHAIWVAQRQVRDALLALDPGARWEKHEARRCPRCRRWCLGIEAQMVRERIERARASGDAAAPCSDECQEQESLWR